MNKAELIEAVQQELGTECSKAHAERAVNSVLNSISHGLEKDTTVQLVGFGSFIVRERKARTGRNPHTGETLSIPASRAPAFKAGKPLKETLNR